MHHRLHSLVPLALLLSLAACGEVVPVDGAANPDAAQVIDAATAVGACEGDTIAIADLRGCVASAQCEWFVGCGKIPGTVADCINMFEGGLDDGLMRIIEAVGAGRTEYDAAAAAACLESFGTVSCNEEPGAECDDVFVGTIADGGQCFVENECSGVDADCNSVDCSDQCCSGVCVDRAIIGGDCSIRNCERDAHCVSSVGGGASECRSGDLGSGCLQDFHCDDDLFCGAASTCVNALGANASCIRGSQCQDPLDCVPAGGGGGNQRICAAIDTVGAPCDGFCRNDLFCQQPDTGGIGMCAAKLGIGASCGQGQGPCQSDLSCRPSDLTCQARPGLNMACAPNDCAAGSFCTAELPGQGSPGVCAQPVVAGLPCDRDSHCETGICGGAQRCEAYLSCY